MVIPVLRCLCVYVLHKTALVLHICSAPCTAVLQCTLGNLDIGTKKAFILVEILAYLP